jgi:hypothetical protein
MTKISCESHLRYGPAVSDSPILLLPASSDFVVIGGTVGAGIVILGMVIWAIVVYCCRRRRARAAAVALQAHVPPNHMSALPRPLNSANGVIVFPAPAQQASNTNAPATPDLFAFLQIYEEEHTRCSVCFDRRPNCAAVPCGHVYCIQCINMVQNKCPLCRQSIEEGVVLRKRTALEGHEPRSKSRFVLHSLVLFFNSSSLLTPFV